MEAQTELVAGRGRRETEIRIMYNPSSCQDKPIKANE